MSGFAKRMLAVVLCAGAFVGTGVSVAYAGEITGQGESLKVGTPPALHGGSECAYSGLNDEYVLGDHSKPRVQTPAGAGGAVVGQACRGFASRK
jgi:hypothetical protein